MFTDNQSARANYVPYSQILKVTEPIDHKIPEILNHITREQMVLTNFSKLHVAPKSMVKIPEVVVQGGPIEIKEDHVEKQFEKKKN